MTSVPQVDLVGGWLPPDCLLKSIRHVKSDISLRKRRVYIHTAEKIMKGSLKIASTFFYLRFFFNI